MIDKKDISPKKVVEYRSLLVPRVSHLDAQYLDSEIHSLLKTTLLESVQLAGVGLYTRLEPEVDALLRWLVYRLTVVRSRTSVGQQLLQMKYSETVPRATLNNYGLLIVLFPWLQKRFMDISRLFIKDEDQRGRLFSGLNAIEVTYRVLHILNLLLFLREGYYSTLGERLLRLRPVPTVPPHLRQISYSFFSRELLWHGFAELLTFFLPLIPAHRLHNTIKSFLPSRMQRQNEAEPANEAKLSREVVCMVCGHPPIIPYQFGCTHLACYYCISTKHAQEQNLKCLLCGYVLEDPAQIGPVRSQP